MPNLKRANESQPQTKSKRSRGRRHPTKEDEAHQVEMGTPDLEHFDMQEDDGRLTTLSQVAECLNNLVSQGNQKDLWQADFSQKLIESQTLALEDLQAAKDKIVSDRTAFEDQFLHVLASAMAPLEADNNVPPPTKPLMMAQLSATSQPLHRETYVLLEESVALLAEYKRFACRGTSTSRLSDLEKAFSSDARTVKDSITAGRQITRSDIQDGLADTRQEVRSCTDLDADQAHLGQCLLASGRKEESAFERGEGWGMVAYQARNGVERMLSEKLMGDCKRT